MFARACNIFMIMLFFFLLQYTTKQIFRQRMLIYAHISFKLYLFVFPIILSIFSSEYKFIFTTLSITQFSLGG